MNGVWQKAADRVRETLGQVFFETWIGPLSFVAMDGGTATIAESHTGVCYVRNTSTPAVAGQRSRRIASINLSATF